MEIRYSNKKTEKLCTNFIFAQREFGQVVAEKLMKTINFIEAAENLKDIHAMTQYHLHPLKGNRKFQYAMDLGRKLGYRIVLIPLDKDGRYLRKSNENELMIECMKIEIEEVSHHYE